MLFLLRAVWLQGSGRGGMSRDGDGAGRSADVLVLPQVSVWRHAYGAPCCLGLAQLLLAAQGSEGGLGEVSGMAAARGRSRHCRGLWTAA